MGQADWFFGQTESCVDSDGNTCKADVGYAHAEYGVAVMEVVLYLGLAILGIGRLIFQNKFKWYSVMIPLLALIRFTNYLLQVINRFSSTQYFWRHFFYITPVCLLVLVYTQIITRWGQFMKKLKKMFKLV